jgi:hypothetical protein
MSHIFFDDSHHQRGEFSLGAFAVFDRDPTDTINHAIADAGLVPGTEEYKSRHPHAADARWTKVRESLFGIASEATIGLLVAPHSDRARLGQHVLAALAHLVAENEIPRPIVAFLDQGLFRSEHQFSGWRGESGLASDVEVHPECDSRAVPGIQVADLIAHTCAVALLGRLGISDKMIRDENEGEYRLSFEMWARLRYQFFRRALTDPDLQEAARAGLVDSRSGLYVAPGCPAELAEAVVGRFGRTWLGCIH